MSEQFQFETIQIHAGHESDVKTGAIAVPIFQTAAYEFDDTDQASDLFIFKQLGFTYTRTGNPTNMVFEKRIAALEGGVAAMATSSGMAAITYAILNIASVGDEIVSSKSLYGATHSLFETTFAQFGITTCFVDQNNPQNFADAITNKTKAIFIETIGNPSAHITDIEAVAAIAREHRIPLIVDNTFATPYLCRPIEHGANIVVHSATKYIGGHGTTIGGVVIDAGNFDWVASGKFPNMSHPDKGRGGTVYTERFPQNAYIVKMRGQLLSNIGACLSPFNAFMLLQGLETLSLRVERHVSNALKVVEFLSHHPKVTVVNYPSLKQNQYHELANKYLPNGCGSIFTFGVADFAAAKKLVGELKLFTLCANFADVKSLIIHPASTTHTMMDEQQQIAAGVAPNLLRVSVGLENIKDILADLDQALAKI